MLSLYYKIIIINWKWQEDLDSRCSFNVGIIGLIDKPVSDRNLPVQVILGQLSLEEKMGKWRQLDQVKND